VLSDMPAAAIHEYLAETVRITRGSILHVNGTESCHAISAWLESKARDFALVEQQPVEWNTARSLQPDETECLYTRSQ
jgi:hypothetical protein